MTGSLSVGRCVEPEDRNLANAGMKPDTPGTENIQGSENARKEADTASPEPEILVLRRENAVLRKELDSMRSALKELDVKWRKRMNDMELAQDAEDTVISGEAERVEAELQQLRKALDAERAKRRMRKPADGEPMERENAVLRKELIETLEKSSANSERLKMLELSAASILDTLTPVYISVREKELAETLELVLRIGSRLASRSSIVSEKAMKLLPEMKMKEVERAKFRVELEELRGNASVFARLNLPPGAPESFEECRILEVNEAAGAVVLSAGYRNGVRVNLTLFADNGSGTKLKVAAVRAFVCVAIPEEGSLTEFAPGMKVHAKK